MKKIAAGKRSLESHPIFPYVAWGVAIGFAVFVYHISTELSVATKELSHQGDRLGQLEAQIEASVTIPSDEVTE